MKRFDITYFGGPPAEYIVKEEVIEDMARAGITLCGFVVLMVWKQLKRL